MYAPGILLAALIAAPAADVVTLDDRAVSGSLVALDSQNVTVETDGTPKPIKLADVLEVRFPQADAGRPQEAAEIALWLRDGGLLSCRQLLAKDRIVQAETVSAGAATFPIGTVSAIRFRPADPAVEEKWTELLQSAPERDVLVVRAGDVLDRLEGTLSGIDAENLTFLVGETRVPIPRSKPKLFGVVLGRSSAAKVEPTGELRFRNGDRLPVNTLKLEGETLAATTTAGGAVNVAASAVQSIDFGRGKVQFLSQLPPREKQHTSYWGDEPPLFEVAVDHSFDGKDRPIRIERQTFRTGLVIYSRTKLTWRLNGEFRRLTAVAGIEQARRSNKVGGTVDLTISADGRTLFSRRVTKADPPIPLELDLTGARELTVFVDFGGDNDIGDHLALGDARLIK